MQPSGPVHRTVNISNVMGLIKFIRIFISELPWLKFHLFPFQFAPQSSRGAVTVWIRSVKQNLFLTLDKVLHYLKKLSHYLTKSFILLKWFGPFCHLSGLRSSLGTEAQHHFIPRCYFATSCSYRYPHQVVSRVIINL